MFEDFDLVNPDDEALLKYGQSVGLTSTTLPGLFKEAADAVGIYPKPHLAVELCVQAYDHEVESLIEAGENAKFAGRAGAIAYRLNIPHLTDAESIRAFIACVAHGMLLGAIPGNEAARLIYAAQVAQSACASHNAAKSRRKRTQKRASKRTATRPPSTT